MNESIKKMWEEYSSKNSLGHNDYDYWYFGDEKIGDELGRLVVMGEKKATTGLEYFYKNNIEPRPKVGDLSIITDTKNRALCIIKVTNVKVVRFKEVDEDFAREEGEGDRSLEYWQKVHKGFFTEILKGYGEKFNEGTKVSLEKFEVVYK